MAISDSTSLKLCSKCGKELPATREYFHTDPRDPSGFRNPCKSCKGVKNHIRDLSLIDVSIPGVKGVSWYKRKGKWHAQIRVSGKRVHLGYFDDLQEASEVYRQAAIKYHGDFARFE